jgi:hypothetical protein
MRTLSCITSLLLALVSFPGGRGAPADRSPDQPLPLKSVPAGYVRKTLEGWTVLVNQELLAADHGQLAEQTLRVLQDHLFRIRRVIPAAALAHLQRVPIWVERAHPRHPCMCYHVSAQWLRQHDMDPRKAGGVEIANAQNFLTWTLEQPWMVLHELAHAYHHQVLGFDHPEVRRCYQQAVASHRYDKVLHINGRERRHYALTNEREYFAETTEAYFGRNDFYPFVRAELRQHDPAGYALMEKLWGVASKH